MDIKLLQDIVNYGIFVSLGSLSFLTILFYIERLLFFKQVDIKIYNHKLQLEIELTKHTTIISSSASNAPYIGLLGTVASIIITFYTMGQGTDIDVKTIMSSLALALKATALGLVVAIPAIFFYNHLGRKIEVLIARWEIVQSEN